MAIRKDTLTVVSGLTPALAVADGGSGDTTPAGARKNFGFEDLGFGVRVVPLVSTLDWQTLDIISGQVVRVSSSNMSNIPAAAGSFGTGVITYFRRMGDSSDARQIWEIWNDPTADSFSRKLQVIVVGASGARTFIVRNIFTSTDTVPLANGGTGATTQAGARTALDVFSKGEIGQEYITGLNLSTDGAVVTVGPGAAYVQGYGIVRTTTNMTVTGTNLTANTWRHIYLLVTGATPSIEVSTVLPVAYAYPAHQKTGDASRRYLGSVVVLPAGGSFVKQVSINGECRYLTAYAGQLVLNAGKATSLATYPLDGFVPAVVNTHVELNVFNDDPSTPVLIYSESTSTGPMVVRQGQEHNCKLLTTGYPSGYYYKTGATTGNGAYIYIRAYWYCR